MFSKFALFAPPFFHQIFDESQSEIGLSVANLKP